jgi:hypothetical protein
MSQSTNTFDQQVNITPANPGEVLQAIAEALIEQGVQVIPNPHGIARQIVIIINRGPNPYCRCNPPCESRDDYYLNLDYHHTTGEPELYIARHPQRRDKSSKSIPLNDPKSLDVLALALKRRGIKVQF